MQGSSEIGIIITTLVIVIVQNRLIKLPGPLPSTVWGS